MRASSTRAERRKKTLGDVSIVHDCRRKGKEAYMATIETEKQAVSS